MKFLYSDFFRGLERYSRFVYQEKNFGDRVETFVSNDIKRDDKDENLTYSFLKTEIASADPDDIRLLVKTFLDRGILSDNSFKYVKEGIHQYIAEGNPNGVLLAKEFSEQYIAGYELVTRDDAAKKQEALLETFRYFFDLDENPTTKTELEQNLERQLKTLVDQYDQAISKLSEQKKQNINNVNSLITGDDFIATGLMTEAHQDKVGYGNPMAVNASEFTPVIIEKEADSPEFLAELNDLLDNVFNGNLGTEDNIREFKRSFEEAADITIPDLLGNGYQHISNVTTLILLNDNKFDFKDYAERTSDPTVTEYRVYNATENVARVTVAFDMKIKQQRVGKSSDFIPLDPPKIIPVEVVLYRYPKKLGDKLSRSQIMYMNDVSKGRSDLYAATYNSIFEQKNGKVIGIDTDDLRRLTQNIKKTDTDISIDMDGFSDAEKTKITAALDDLSVKKQNLIAALEDLPKVFLGLNKQAVSKMFEEKIRPLFMAFEHSKYVLSNAVARSGDVSVLDGLDFSDSSNRTAVSPKDGATESPKAQPLPKKSLDEPKELNSSGVETNDKISKIIKDLESLITIKEFESRNMKYEFSTLLDAKSLLTGVYSDRYNSLSRKERKKKYISLVSDEKALDLPEFDGFNKTWDQLRPKIDAHLNKMNSVDSQIEQIKKQLRSLKPNTKN